MGVKCMYNHTRFTPAFCSMLYLLYCSTYIQRANQLEGTGRTHSFADDRLAYRTCRDKQVTVIVYRRISIGLEHDVKEIMVEYTKKKRRLCGALWTTMQ